MRKKIQSIIICLILIFAIFTTIDLVFEFPLTSGSTTIYVPTNYPTIQEAINAAIDGDTVYVYSGAYFENVIVDKTINLTGENKDNTTIEGVGDVIHVAANWVNVSGFTVKNGSTGIDLYEVNNCKVFNNIASTNDFHGIKFTRCIDSDITNNTVLNSHTGISLSQSSYNDITGNKVSENNYGIALHDANGNNITGNIVYSNNDFGIWLHGFTDSNCIVDNNVSFCGKIGIYLSGTVGITLRNNTMKYNGIRIDGGDVQHWNTHNIDTSNTVNGKPLQYWVNRTRGKVPAGTGQVILANCTNVIIEGQELINCSIGILLGFSSSNIILANIVSSNTYEGIRLFKSNNNTIVNNNVSSNSGFYGIRIHYSDKNNITGNFIYFNYVGIVFYESNYNLITYNTVFLNDVYGIHLGYSYNNTFYHNNFIDNSDQAIDESNNGNRWDNGYPSGGNYWSDFDESSEGAYDDYNGEGQNILGSDGIVDNGTIGGGGKNPYVIDSDSWDNYPLIEPYNNYMILKQGWNLISLPLIQEEQNLTKVLKSINGLYDAVQWYNITDTRDPWKHYKVSKPYGNDLFEINEKMGFWIHITQPGDTIFFYNGTRPTENQTITLYPGWNMVGYPSFNNRDRTTALNNITFGTHVDAIWTYDSHIQRWEKIGPSDYFEIGRGYYIHAKSKCDWEVPC
ncbi:MAG: right-handed parallel beta-helix repeat-containing protein [Thermoplasmata archaeon]|nr:MAG: right-handed parallel beta-helix repeat-containing protein [Thermoplasmata archaeon]